MPSDAARGVWGKATGRPRASSTLPRPSKGTSQTSEGAPMRQILLAAGILGGVMPGLPAQPIPATAAAPAAQEAPAAPAAQEAPQTAASPSPVAAAGGPSATPRFADSVVVTPALDAQPRDD